MENESIHGKPKDLPGACGMTDVKDMTAEELARYGTIPPRIQMTAMEEAAAHEILVRLTELATLRADNARLKQSLAETQEENARLKKQAEAMVEAATVMEDAINKATVYIIDDAVEQELWGAGRQLRAAIEAAKEKAK